MCFIIVSSPTEEEVVAAALIIMATSWYFSATDGNGVILLFWPYRWAFLLGSLLGSSSLLFVFALE